MTRIFVKSFGCSANFSDGEMMQGLLKEIGKFNISKDARDADLIIVNACTVKGENTALKEIKQLHELFPYKKLIITGCLTEKLMAAVRELSSDVSFVSTHNIKDIVQVVEETLHDDPVSIIAKKGCKKILLPRVRKNPVIGIVQISTGCVNCCTYCSTKLIKGNLKSFSIEEICEDVKNLVKDGCKEIWLTSQDTACYGQDIGTNLPELLKKVCEVEGDFLVRLGMGNPKHFKNMIEELIEAFKHPKMFKFLHIPVQSGNDDILRKMNRGYNSQEFMAIIKQFREAIPKITISTDVIVGFPSETEEQFNDSVRLIEEIRPAVLNISRFVAREGTKAFDLPQIHGEVKKDRSRLLTSVHEWVSREVNKRWKNWEGEILIDEEGKEESSIGRNKSYVPIVVKKVLPLGSKVNVKITEIGLHYVIGEIIE